MAEATRKNPFASEFMDKPVHLAEVGAYSEVLRRRLRDWMKKHLVDPKYKVECDWDVAFFFEDELNSHPGWPPLTVTIVNMMDPNNFNRDFFRKEFNIYEHDGALVWHGRPDCPTEKYIVCYRTLAYSRKTEAEAAARSHQQIINRGQPKLQEGATGELKAKSQQEKRAGGG